eukprot:6209923-Pleurochrysis_carterae.AAC.2
MRRMLLQKPSTRKDAEERLAGKHAAVKQGKGATISARRFSATRLPSTRRSAALRGLVTADRRRCRNGCTSASKQACACARGTRCSRAGRPMHECTGGAAMAAR